MESRHEVVIPNEDLPFKMFIFEGRNGRIYNTAGELRNIIKEIMEEKDFVSDKKTNAEVAALYDWDNIVSDFGFLKELFS